MGLTSLLAVIYSVLIHLTGKWHPLLLHMPVLYSTLLHALLVGYQAHILDVSHYTIQSLQQLSLHALHHC